MSILARIIYITVGIHFIISQFLAQDCVKAQFTLIELDSTSSNTYIYGRVDTTYDFHRYVWWNKSELILDNISLNILYEMEVSEEYPSEWYFEGENMLDIRGDAVRYYIDGRLISFYRLCSKGFKVISNPISQQAIHLKIDSLEFVKQIPYSCANIIIDGKPSYPDEFVYDIGCGDKLFWEVVKLKHNAIPYLIEQLDNTTEAMASFPNQGGQCKVGDIAYYALSEIVHGIPTAELLQVNPEEFDCGWCYYHKSLTTRKDRKRFKNAVKEWFDENKSNLQWMENNDYQICDCSGKHPNGGHYKVESE